MATNLLAEKEPINLLADSGPKNLLASTEETEPSFISSTLKSMKNAVPDWALAPAEAVITMGTGLAASSVAGFFVGIPSLIAQKQQEGYLGKSVVDPVANMDAISGAMTYGVGSDNTEDSIGYGRTATKETEAILNVVNYPFEKWSEHVAKPGGELAQNLGAYPAVAAGIETALEFAPWVILPAAYRKGKHGYGPKGDVQRFYEAQAEASASIAKIATAEPTALAKATSPLGLALIEDIKAVVAPIGTGAPIAQAIVKNYTNTLAGVDRMLADNFKRMTLRFKPKELQQMYEAASADELAIATGVTPTAIDALPLDMRTQARATMAIHDGIAAQAVEAGILPYHKEGYVPRTIIRELGRSFAERIYGTKAVKTATKHAKKRKYKTVEETEAAAIEALGEDVRVSRDFRQYALVDAELMRAIAGKKLIKEVRELGTSTGKEMVKYWDGKDTPGYFRLDNPAFTETRPEIKLRPKGDVGPRGGKTKVRKDQEGEIVWKRRPLEIDKDFEGPLRAALEGNPNKVYRGIMQLKSASMQAIMVSPLMHGMVIWGKALPYQPIRSLTFKNYREGHRIENITKGDVQGLAKEASNNEWIRSETKGVFKTTEEYKAFMMRTGHRPIGDMGWMQRMSDIMQSPSIVPGRSLVSRLVGYPSRMFGKNAQMAAMRGVDKAGHFWHDTLLWDQVRASGYGMHLNIWKKLTKSGVDPDLAGHVASHMANRFTGSIPFEDLSAGTRATMNAMLFSKSFTGTNLGLYVDAIRGLPRAVQNQILHNYGDLQGIGKSNNAVRWAATATLMKDIIGMYVLNSLTQNAIKIWQQSIDLEIEGLLDGPGGEKFVNIDREKLHSAIQEVKHEYEMAAERYDIAKGFFSYDELSVTALNDPNKKYRVHWRTKPDGTWEYIRVPIGKVGEDLEKVFKSPVELLMNKLSPTLQFEEGLRLNDKSGFRGYGIEVYDKDGSLIEKIGQIAWYFLEQHTADEFATTFIDAVSGDKKAEEAWKLMMMTAGFSFSKGTPGGPVGGQEYKELDHKLAVARRAQGKAKPLLEDGKYDEAVQILINEGQMSPAEIKSWLTSKLAPQMKSLSPGRIEEVYLHSNELERLRLTQLIEQMQLEQLQP